ncbi:MAG: hypothetical protein H0T80_08135 [Betaproteobacteria bacterium]|nr:hypothetical protein [Betaproteobacteria bacterium]
MTPADAQAFGRIAFNIDVRHAQLGGKQIRSNRDSLPLRYRLINRTNTKASATQ